ncbi:MULTISPECIES: hypothetical protein [unclassified Herbaspirillum]|uniref:hypothetical protein n=1 Tax=unclassified Herbaspirillum TaxID=2624150 RepID=UPI0011507B49|nr:MULTISPECIES: hypothetical protein [unclassified Herbaspirillum]MBB5393963.1 hypothetical protein [Herbaspirillum sp. SJZ102]TQK00001.1 hypothetical protein FB599_3963 [Herbaspirillum sp. SJZ130]TQK04675.1 hypothetical protein FB598_3997 [Herbaspirillum sp. SJZ106]
MAEANELMIAALPTDGNAWRIDWFGEIAFPNRMIRRKQPSVLLHLSRVIDERYREDHSVLLNPESTFVAKQRKVWVSVGTLPLLRIGDIWRDGLLETTPDYQFESFSDLDIGSETVSLIKAGLNLEENGFLLPRGEHPWHMQATQSYCLMIALPGERRLIIPCLELIRFYFGSSSNLLTKLFLPPLNRDVLYRKAHHSKINGQLSIALAEGISGASAADIGRMHMDSTAWRSAVNVGTSLLKASVSNQEIHPQAHFPFEGQTTLTASGKWLSFSGEPHVTFLAYSLRSCSHPFPFRSLRYDVEDRRAAPANTTSLTEASTPRLVKPARQSSDRQLVEEDASGKLVRQVRSVWAAQRFTDLTKKTIWKKKILAAQPSGATLVAGPTSDTNVAVGDVGSDRRVRSVDLQIKTKDKSKFPVPDFLKEVVDDLKALREWKLELLTESSEDGWTIPISILADEEGEIDFSLFIAVGENQLRERRVSAFSAINNRVNITIVVTESAPPYTKLYLMEPECESNLPDTLQRATSDFISRDRDAKSEAINIAIRRLTDEDDI